MRHTLARHPANKKVGKTNVSDFRTLDGQHKHRFSLWKIKIPHQTVKRKCQPVGETPSSRNFCGMNGVKISRQLRGFHARAKSGNANSLANRAGIADAKTNFMKANYSKQRNRGLTLTEVLVIIFVLAVLVAMFLPALGPTHPYHSRISCVNNLKQVGLASRIWEGDNNDLYPTAVSVTNGGAMELAATGNAAAVFQVMSNELSTPRILACPADKNINSFATNFSDVELKNKISYFVGLDATNEANPNLLIAGDDNFLVNGAPIKSGLSEISSNVPVAWDDARHAYVNRAGWFSKNTTCDGNAVFGDGSVQQLTQNGLKQAIQQTGLATNRLAIP